ncbi:LisH [Aphelenchoides besseyi]|nr:LisH [Aphelenchoides besseyi]KAI6200097.1 LisH [Aphelenchoides besseyi]
MPIDFNDDLLPPLFERKNPPKSKPNEAIEASTDDILNCESKNWFNQFMNDYETHLSDEQIKTLLMDYFVSEGFEDAARSLADELGHEYKPDEYRESCHLTERNEIREAVQNGDLDKAIDLIKKICPNLLEENKTLNFDLLRQKLVELIRNEKVEEALEFSQKHLVDMSNHTSEQLQKLEQTYALLAFNKPDTSPFGFLMHANQRMSLASEINSALLAEFKSTPVSRLEFMKQQMVWNCAQNADPININKPLDARLSCQIAIDLFGEKDELEDPILDESLSP